MNDESAFLAAIAASPKDELQYLVFADWLEEQGDPRGVWLRDRAIRAVMGPKLEDPLVFLKRDLVRFQGKRKSRHGVVALGLAAIDMLLELSEHEVPAVRAEAVELLQALEEAKVSMPETVTGRLFRMLEDPDGRPQYAAVRALAVHRPLRVSMPSQIFGENNRSRSQAIDAYRRYRPEEDILGELAGPLESPDADTRWKAVVALGRLRTPAAFTVLCRKLDDPDPQVVRVTLNVLYSHICPSSTDGLESIGRCLSSEDEQTAGLAAKALSQTGNPETMHLLVALALRTESEAEKGGYLYHLGKCGCRSPEGIRHLTAVFQQFPGRDLDSLIRGIANDFLPPAELLPILVDFVRRFHNDNETSVAVPLQWLARMRPVAPEVIDLFRELLRDGANNTRTFVCYAIKEYLAEEGTALLPDLEAALQDHYDYTIPEAIASMGEAGVRSLSGLLSSLGYGHLGMVFHGLTYCRAAARSTAPKLLALLADPACDPHYQFRAATLLLEWGNSVTDAIPDLSVATRHLVAEWYSKPLIHLGDDVIRHLPALERDMFARVEQKMPKWFARVLGRLPTKDVALPYLRRMLHECRPGGALAQGATLGCVIQAFGQVGASAREDVPSLLTHVGSTRADVRQKVVVALGRIGGDAAVVAALVECLRDVEPKVVHAAANVLGELGSPEAIDGLTDRLNDMDDKTVLRSATALGKIKNLPATTIGALTQLQTHSDPAIRKRATEAIRRGGSPSR